MVSEHVWIHKDPPWKAYPEYSRGCMGWRMGGGEDYMDQWLAWFRARTAEEKSAYAKENPPPSGWESFYEGK